MFLIAYKQQNVKISACHAQMMEMTMVFGESKKKSANNMCTIATFSFMLQFLIFHIQPGKDKKNNQLEIPTHQFELVVQVASWYSK